ncbi:hypothetical protein HMPREF0693_1944 [Proteus mirabilis ATCC 29906]|nr:hypothetical protein CSC16_2032 [Proteus mirabilis]EEI48106.1 hypothetical protein HMPREF0693_1944 [Proteus mirabilis ATCC 29906]KXC01493.1 hypothetical protein HMPREF3203_01028 [Proteus mirabilis]
MSIFVADRLSKNSAERIKKIKDGQDYLCYFNKNIRTRLYE